MTTKKLLYDYVKSQIESFSYVLIDKNYQNSKKKLKLICNMGHEITMSYNSFQRGDRCGICNTGGGNNRLQYDDVVSRINSVMGYQIISDNYKNNSEKIKIQCPNNHIFSMSLSNYQSGNRCPYCSQRAKKTILEIKSIMEACGHTLLSEEYVNAHSKLKILCPNNHIFYMKWSDFSQDHRCPHCSFINGKSKSENEIVEYIRGFYNDSILENDRTQIINPITGKFLELDIWLPKLNKAIEYNGEYWHRNKYQKYKDKIKQNFCKENNINLLVINDEDWRSNKNECFNMIHTFIC